MIMRMMLVGAGAVGESIMKVLKWRDPSHKWLEYGLICDYDEERAKEIADTLEEPDRFQAAKDDGFEAVEFWDWRIRDLDATREAAQKAGIAISGFNGDADFSLVDPTHKTI